MNTSTDYTGRRARAKQVRSGRDVASGVCPEVSGSALPGAFARRAGGVPAGMERTLLERGRAIRAMRWSRPRAVAAAALSMLVVLLGCTTTDPASSPGAPATPALHSSPATLEAEQDLVVDGRHFKAQCTGRGRSVLLVNGYDATMDEWADVPTRLGATARTCMYDRLGTGRSDAPPPSQTFEDLADDLDGVISALRLPRPVVVVASDLGGPIAVTWAAHHQRDARALVMLDTIPPGWQAVLPSLLPPPDPGDPELTGLLRAVRRFDVPLTNRESLDPTSWAAYDRISSLDAPLWVLVADVPPRLPWAVDAVKFTAAWQAGQSRLAGLSFDRHLVTAAGADTIIWLGRLDLVLSTVAAALNT
ncbi:alpha/beta fold hydrolase [Terrabacter sp. Ter38]|uniref:alpha/beta fold hydrolase n=1 Tax=Terrabacter sp. Ter38 TaxID=2926030 RepID=UPI002118412C|nr:alpha/beta fold hydrolase [Terrabacter sp. Ter38]